MKVETEKPVKVVVPELSLEDIGKDETITADKPKNKGNARQQFDALLASTARAHVKYMADEEGRTIFSVSAQVENKTPAPLPKTDSLKLIETDRGTPTLAVGHPDDETPLFPDDNGVLSE